MGFWGSSFIFDGIPSITHNLFINSANSGGSLSEFVTSSDVEIFSEQIYRRPKVYFFGTSQSPVLEFDVEFTSPSEIDSVRSQAIQRWLFGHNQYKNLQIIQNDMQLIYYRCILSSPRILKSGREIYGYKATVICDSPFAWEFPKTISLSYTDPVIAETYNFVNLSDDNDYLYPSLEISINSIGGDISITNGNDSDREFLFSGLNPNEVLTVDNSKGIITSSSGLNRLGLFNKKWLRFVPGLNSLEIAGNISQLDITYELARKVGT